MGPCTFYGFCTNYGGANYSKASAITTVLPALMLKENFTVYTNCEVLEMLTDSSGKKATGVTYVDSSGDTWEQPADLVIVAAFTFENVRLILLSQIGETYDPVTSKGTTGRNYAYQTAKSISCEASSLHHMHQFVILQHPVAVVLRDAVPGEGFFAVHGVKIGFVADDGARQLRHIQR